MENKQTIEKIRETSEAYLSKVENEDFRQEHSLKDIQFQGDSMMLGGVELNKTAQNKIFNFLRVKSNFSKYSGDMTEADWNSVSSKIKAIQGDKRIVAQYKNEEGTKISNIFPKNTKKKHTDHNSLRSYFDTICDELGQTTINYGFDGMTFQEKSHTFDVTLTDKDTKIDVFNDKGDIWNGGHAFTFTPVSFYARPFFERLVCANGMRAKKFGFDSNIQQTKFNVDKISKTIRKAISEGSNNLHDMVAGSCQHLRNNEVSLAEFYSFRSIFSKDIENKAFRDITDNFFDDSPIYQAYGMNIAEKSNKWKATAKSGINAYDFFNLLTWIASHPSETGLDVEEARVLQLKASNFFFKENFDLEDIAKPINIAYPILQQMQ